MFVNLLTVAVVSGLYALDTGPPPTLGTTWAILERDGANRQVRPYLSSLGQGESGTGSVVSPPFVIDRDTITFTVCGHDGQGGGRDENYVALLDVRKGQTLRKTVGPGNDAMQTRTWDVAKWKGQEVRIEVHDGNSGGAFAWLGVGRIDAGPALQVDFGQGLPDHWQRPERTAETRYELVPGAIPFRRNVVAYTLIPVNGSVELACGFAAKRLYFLGGTIASGKPLATYGGIEIHYRSRSPDVIPLIYGFTLDGRNKLLSRSPAMHLHPSSDPYQHYLVVEPHADVIEMIRLVANPGRAPRPRITAITCETSADSDRLVPLSADGHGADQPRPISVGALRINHIARQIRAAHQLPANVAHPSISFQKHTLDGTFRSEGVAVADLDGDGRLDITTGNMIYAAPDWSPSPMLGEPVQFNRKGYSDAFLCFADDVNHDGATDVIVVGFPGQQTFWLANPGQSDNRWTKHLAVRQTGNESPFYADVNRDGQSELVFMDGARCSAAGPGRDPTKPWTIRAIAARGDPGPGHGLGMGDVNGDHRPDIIIANGWWEGPRAGAQRPWQFHPAELFGGAQLCVWDFDGDGDQDVLGSSAHGYGIAWNEQTPAGWKRHQIDAATSQTHALHLADINGDGLMDFVTGKRFWAHNGHDPGSFEPAVLYWYELRRQRGRPQWTRHEIDLDSGCGLHIEIADVDRDGLLDLVTSNKKGVYWFRQRRR